MIATPVEFEIYDGKELLAKVKMFDEGGVSVEIKSMTDEKSWPDISRVIQHALDLMFQPEEIK